MKIFIDTAHVEDIKKAAEYGLVDGVTTNPTLVAKELKPHRQVIQEIAKVVKGPISVEGNCIDCDDCIRACFSIQCCNRAAKACKIL